MGDAQGAEGLEILIARGRVGFIVDAAIQGFADGAGFAVGENIISRVSVSV